MGLLSSLFGEKKPDDNRTPQEKQDQKNFDILKYDGIRARNMGRLYRTLDKWNFCFITPCENFEQYFGRRADKKRQLYNAGIKCTYYCFNGPKPPKAEDGGTSGK